MRARTAAAVSMFCSSLAFAQSIVTIGGGGSLDGRPAKQIGSFFRSAAVAVDPSTSDIFLLVGHQAVRVRATGKVSIYAGSGFEGFGGQGDGGPAVEAALSHPQSLAFDRNQNLLIAGVQEVRRVDRKTGVISTLAGGQFGEMPRDNVPATEAILPAEPLITTDCAGNVYIAEAAFHVVQVIEASSGLIKTIAGNGSPGDTGDGGPARDASLRYPRAVAVACRNSVPQSLFIIDAGNNRLRRVDLESKIITAFAGSGERGFKDGTASSAQFSLSGIHPIYDAATAITAFENGDVYVGEFNNNALRKISGGNVTTLRLSIPDRFFAPTALWPVSPTKLLVNNIAQTILEIDLATLAGTTVAAVGELSPGNGGPARASVIHPAAMLVKDSGDVHFVERASGQVRVISATTGIIDRVVGGGTNIPQAGASSTSVFLNPSGLARDRVGNLYFADHALGRPGGRIWRHNISSRTLDLIAGDGTDGIAPDGAIASTAPLSIRCPFSDTEVALDRDENLYFTECGSGRIRRVEKTSGRIFTVAGTGGVGDDLGVPATQARISYPGGMAFDTSGNLYFADAPGTAAPTIFQLGTLIKKVDRLSGVISLVAGVRSRTDRGGFGGPATDAYLNFARSITFDRDGNLVIGSSYQSIGVVDRNTGIISAIAGTEFPNLLGDFGPFHRYSADIFDLDYGPTGDLIISDSSNFRIRRVQSCRLAINGPVLTTPANGATEVSTAPILQWQAVDGAFTYDVHLDTENATTRVLTDLTGTTYVPSNLAPGTTYRWRIFAKSDPNCPNLLTSSSPTFSFTVARGCPAPNSFALTAPAQQAIATSSSVSLAWVAASGAGKYDVYFGPSNPPPFFTTSTATSVLVSNLVSSVRYYWRIVARSSCNAALTTASELRFFDVSTGSSCATPSAFQLLAPAAGATGVPLSTVLQWGSSAGATGYDLHFGTTSPPPLYLPNLGEPNFAINGLAPGVTYYWNVRARTACSASATAAASQRSFTTSGTCTAPGRPAFTFSPPGSISVGHTYVLTWSEAFGIGSAGLYEIERFGDAGFQTPLDVQIVDSTAASFIAPRTGTYHHRVRGIAGCDSTRKGPYSESVVVNAINGNPNVVFTVNPPAVISNLGQRLEEKRASFTIENISDQSVNVIIGSSFINSSPFFSIADPSGNGFQATLNSREPKTFELRFSGPPNDQPASYQGVIVVSAANSPIIPYAFVNLKIGSSAGATPEILVDGIKSEYAFFAPFAGDDSLRPPKTITVRNPGSTPMEVAAEIGPEAWLEPESGWNSDPIPPGASRDLRLFTRRTRAPNGSALPRYTYLTLRTRTGDSSRILIQDTAISTSGNARPLLGDVSVRSFIVPDVVSTAAEVSKIRLTNAGSSDVEAILFFTRSESDGVAANNDSGVTIKLPANDVVTLTDPVAQLFNSGGRGQLEVRLSPENIGLTTIHASTVGRKSTERSSGFIPAVWRGEGAPRDATFVVGGVTSDASHETDLLLVETTGIDSVTARVTLIRGDGSATGTTTVRSARYGHIVIREIATALGETAISSARLEVRALEGGGRVLPLIQIRSRSSENKTTLVGEPAIGSSTAGSNQRMWQQIHNKSLATTPGFAAYVVPLASNNAGGGSTALGLTSSLASQVDVQVEFRGTPPIVKIVTLAARSTREFKDALRELFDISNSTGGTLVVNAPLGVQVYSRLLAAPIGGILPLPVAQNPVIPLNSPLPAGAFGSAQRLLYVEGLSQSIEPSSAQWSVVATEVSGESATFELLLFEPGNRRYPIARNLFEVAPLGRLVLEPLFSAMGLNSEERRKDRTNMLCVLKPVAGKGLITAIAVEKSSSSTDMRAIVFSPLTGFPASGVALAQPIGAVHEERPPRKRGARR